MEQDAAHKGGTKPEPVIPQIGLVIPDTVSMEDSRNERLVGEVDHPNSQT